MTKQAATKTDALSQAISFIRKQFGKEAIWGLDEDSPTAKVESISTGCLSLDSAMGIGGLPRGRVCEIY
ncbi:MAG: DNA recombination/repair protein RecA, partial [Myxococcota bacterium]|nr:DNA recombination/repair protein RecA [Myxococcota bacterium]